MSYVIATDYFSRDGGAADFSKAVPVSFIISSSFDDLEDAPDQELGP